MCFISKMHIYTFMNLFNVGTSFTSTSVSYHRNKLVTIATQKLPYLPSWVMPSLSAVKPINPSYC